MDDTLHFTDQAATQLLAVYLTPDMVAQRKEVTRILQLQEGEKVLDVGSGPGFLAADMAAMVGPAGEVHGIDISEELLAQAQRKFASVVHLQFHHATATYLPFPEQYFNAVVATQVLEYLPDVGAALRQFCRVLKPGGRILVLDTDWDSLVWHSDNPGRMKKILQAWDEHLVDPYLPRTLMSKLKLAGLKPKEQTIIPLFNPTFSEETFSNHMIDLIGTFVRGRQGIDERDADAWAKELRQQGKQGDYFFSLNRYVFVAAKDGEEV